MTAPERTDGGLVIGFEAPAGHREDRGRPGAGRDRPAAGHRRHRPGRRPASRSSDRGFVEVDTATMATNRPGRLRDRRRGRHPRPRARGVRRGHRGDPGTSSARRRCRSTTRGVPWVVYTHPEVAWAGLTEAEARAAGHDVEVHKHKFAGNGRAMIIGETDGMVKVVAAEGRPDPRLPPGRPVGQRAAGRGLPRRQLGGAPRRRSATSSTRTPACPRRSGRRC